MIKTFGDEHKKQNLLCATCAQGTPSTSKEGSITKDYNKTKETT